MRPARKTVQIPPVIIEMLLGYNKKLPKTKLNWRIKRTGVVSLYDLALLKTQPRSDSCKSLLRHDLLEARTQMDGGWWLMADGFVLVIIYIVHVSAVPWRLQKSLRGNLPQSIIFRIPLFGVPSKVRAQWKLSLKSTTVPLALCSVAASIIYNWQILSFVRLEAYSLNCRTRR